MDIEELTKAMRLRAADRYELLVDGAQIDYLLSLSPREIQQHGATRLRRLAQNRAGWRTVLIAVLDNLEDYPLAALWAANVRDALQEPETADLYLIISIPSLSPDVCTNIEANEHFCRKYVFRPGEDPMQLIDRTFLSVISPRTELFKQSEPLSVALAQTGSRHAWLQERAQNSWRKALLSGQSGRDLAEYMLCEVPAER